MDLKDMKQAAQKAIDDLRNLQKKRNAEKQRLEDEARQRIAAELAVLDAEIERHVETAKPIIAAYEKELIASVIIAGKPWPEGTIVVRPLEPSDEATIRRKKGEVRGKVQVWRRGEVTPKSSHRVPPEPGDVIVRLLKADGTPSAHYESLPTWNVGRWRAEDGLEPKLDPKPDWLNNL